MISASGIEVGTEDGSAWDAVVTSFERARRGAEPSAANPSIEELIRARQLTMLQHLREGLAALAALRWGEH